MNPTAVYLAVRAATRPVRVPVYIFGAVGVVFQWRRA